MFSAAVAVAMVMAMAVATTMAITMAAAAETGVAMARGILVRANTHIKSKCVPQIAENLT